MGGWNNTASFSSPSALQRVPREAPESHLGKLTPGVQRKGTGYMMLLTAIIIVIIIIKILANIQ